MTEGKIGKAALVSGNALKPSHDRRIVPFRAEILNANVLAGAEIQSELSLFLMTIDPRRTS